MKFLQLRASGVCVVAVYMTAGKRRAGRAGRGLGSARFATVRLGSAHQTTLAYY